MSEKSARSTTVWKPLMLVVCLIVVGAWTALAGSVLGIRVLIKAAELDTFDVWVLTDALTYVAAGWSMACLLWAVGWLAGRQHEASVVRGNILLTLRAWNRPQPDAAAPTSAPSDKDRQPEYIEALNDVLAELRQLNSNVLLTEDQREAKRLRRQQHIAERMAGEAEHAL